MHPRLTSSEDVYRSTSGSVHSNYYYDTANENTSTGQRKKEVDSDLEYYLRYNSSSTDLRFNSSSTDLRLDSASNPDLDFDWPAPTFARYNHGGSIASGFDPSLSSFSSTCEGVAAPSSFYLPDAYGYSYRPRNGALVDEDLFMECQPLYPETDIYPLSPMYESGLWEPHRMRAASEMIRQRNRTSSVTAAIPRSYSSVDTESFASPLSLCNPSPSNPLPSTTLSSPVSSAADLVSNPPSLPQEVVELPPKKPQSSVSSSNAPSSLPPSAPRSGQASSVSSGGQRSGSVSSSGQRSGSVSSGGQRSGAAGRGRSGSQGSGHGKKKGGNSEGEDVNVDKLRSGEDTRTCVMLRNLPNRYHMENLHNMLYEAVGDHYNIVSLPLDSDTHRNLGYCFVKFKSVDDLIRAYEHMQGRSWPYSESHKTCRFCYAKIQREGSIAKAQLRSKKRAATYTVPFETVNESFY